MIRVKKCETPGFEPGKSRPGFLYVTLHCWPWNEFLVIPHFKMEGISSLRDLVQKGDFFCKVDLKDAYLTVPMSSASQTLLEFQWNGRQFQFRALPFGLVPAPWIFTKILHPVIAVLRRWGYRLVVYLDDILVIGCSAGEAILATALIQLLYCLGFIMNIDKLVLLPTQEIEYLGFLVCSHSMSLCLTTKKGDKIRSMCRTLLRVETPTLRNLASCIGTLTASWPAVLPVPLYTRALQLLQAQAVRQEQTWNTQVQLSAEAQEDLEWWCNHLHGFNGRPLQKEDPILLIRSDAATEGGGGGWGAICGTRTTGGRWSPEEQTWHINALELQAARFAVQTFAKKVTGTVALQLDNQVAVQYINRMGGVRSRHLNQLA